METRSITVLSYGLLAAIISMNPVLIILGASINKGLPTSQVVSWTFGCYVVAGMIGMALSWKTKLPICGSQSVPAAVLLGTALVPFTFEEAAGSYLIAGLIMLLLGVSGTVNKMINFLPIEIVMAMFAGTMMKFAVGIVTITQQHMVIGISCLAGYLLFHCNLRMVPAPLGGILFGVITAWTQGAFETVEKGSMFIPSPFLPDFSWGSILSLSIPMVVLIIGTEGVQGISGLKLGGYEPPVNKMVITSGLGTMLSSTFGGHSANTAGIMTTVCAAPEVGRLEERYKASMFAGLLVFLFGLFSSLLIPVMMSFPRYLIELLTGIALTPILIQSLGLSFGTTRYRFSAFITFIIAMSGISIWGISAPLWSLVVGILLLLTVENVKDFPQNVHQVIR